MNAAPRIRGWSLRTKMAALFILASFLPSGIVMLAQIPGMRQRMVMDVATELTARNTQLVQRIDDLHHSYRRVMDDISRLPDVTAFCAAGRVRQDALRANLATLLGTWPASDPYVRGLAILDMSGRVTGGTEPSLVGSDLFYRPHVREALRGHALISDVHLAEQPVGEAPTIAYLAPVFATDGKQCGVAALWLRATALWDLMKQSNELAGPGSFAVAFDGDGIRIAHTYNDDIIFHPAAELAPAVVDALVAERRFGARTRQLLTDVRPFPQQFERARAQVLDTGMFRGLAPVNNKWNYGVARRAESVPWTVFYMVPDAALNAALATATWKQAGMASLSVLIALLGGAWFATVLLRPVTALSKATDKLAAGDLQARTEAGHAGEARQARREFQHHGRTHRGPVHGAAERPAINWSNESKSARRGSARPRGIWRPKSANASAWNSWCARASSCCAGSSILPRMPSSARPSMA